MVFTVGIETGPFSNVLSSFALRSAYLDELPTGGTGIDLAGTVFPSLGGTADDVAVEDTVSLAAGDAGAVAGAINSPTTG